MSVSFWFRDGLVFTYLMMYVIVCHCTKYVVDDGSSNLLTVAGFFSLAPIHHENISNHKHKNKDERNAIIARYLSPKIHKASNKEEKGRTTTSKLDSLVGI